MYPRIQPLCCTEGLHSTSTIVTTSLTARTPKTFAHFTPPTRTPEASGAALAFAAASPTPPRSPPPARARWFRSAPRSRARRMERSLRHRQVMRTTRAGVCGHPLRPRGFPLGRRQMGRSLGGRRMGCPRAPRRRPRGGARRLRDKGYFGFFLATRWFFPKRCHSGLFIGQGHFGS